MAFAQSSQQKMVGYKRAATAILSLTFGFLAARLLLERWQGMKSRDHALFEFARLRNRR